MNCEKKISTWLSILILVGLGISVGPHQVLTRTSEVERVLSPVLSSYEVIRMEPAEIERQVRTTGELRLRFDGVDFYFNLEPHDLRAPNYRAEATGPGGVRRRLPTRPVHTFKGVLAGREDTRGRFNLTDGGVEGVVYAPEGWYYVEPLRNHLRSASPGDLVVYRHSDIKAGEALECDVLLPGRLQRGVARVAAQTEVVPPINYVADVATEADYEYVQAAGGAEEANREIEGILNVVEEVFQSELLVQLRLIFQNAWEVEEDPYNSTTMRDLLRELYSYWNDHFAAEQDYDVLHLWTGKQFHGIAGLASWKVCHSTGGPNWPYSASARGTSFSRKYVTPAHEIGHNFGASHPDKEIPPIASCTNTIMNIRGGDSQLTFCQFSRDEIAAHLAVYNSCLDTQPIRLQPPSGLSATATSESRIHLSWRDNSANETGFMVERRRHGSGVWVEIGTTAADTEAFTSEGLFSEAAYLHRVQAFNDSESSAYSNEASATTRVSVGVATGWRIDTLAGRTDNDGDNGPANRARLADPEAVAVDGSGNLYIADSENHRIRRVDGAGTITTVAGTGERGYGGDGGPAVEARLNGPRGVAVDGSGNLYIADSGNHRIRRLEASGIITTVAGNGERGFGGDGGAAVEAQLYLPLGVAVDGSGALYIADTFNRRIRRVDRSGTITTVAGNGGIGYGRGGGPAVRTSLNVPLGVAVDGSGNLYIAESDQNRIHRVDASGIITTVAGTGEGGGGGDGGRAVEARLNSPISVAVDRAGNLYIAEYSNHRIRRVDVSGIITTVAGTGEIGFSGDGGPAVEARLWHPGGVAVDGSGALYIADTFNHRIRRVDASGALTTIAGIGESDFSGDGGLAAGAWLNQPEGVAVDTSGNVYIADTHNHRVRRVDASGIITTVAGTGEWGFGRDAGPAVEVPLAEPVGVAVDEAGNLYIAVADRILRVNSQGIISRVTTERVVPDDVAVDGAGNVYVADGNSNRIQRVDASGSLTTVAGTGERGFSGDGGPAVKAQLNNPTGVAVDEMGAVYIADRWNHRIRRVDASGVITTDAGIGEGSDSGGMGPATEAALNWPEGVAVDRRGNLYIADTYNHRIRRVDASGTITTIAGTGVEGFSGDGGLAVEAQLNQPTGVAVDSAGNVYVADRGNHRIRILSQPPRPPSPPTRLTATAVSFSGIRLKWQDNSTNETGFEVQRRDDGSARWIEIRTTASNATSFSDTGLKPTTTYHYRVRAFNSSGASAFSNETSATTLEVFPPTLTRFTPTSGPSGTRVTLTGTHFHGATDVQFNGVSALEFEVVSGTSIEVIVPAGATSGPISVVAPGGTVVSADPFTVTAGFRSRLFVPIVLRSQGRTAGSLFTSELTLTNRGNTKAAVNYTYTAAFGGGSGTAVDSLEAGRQRVIPDAIAYLTSLGVPIGSRAAGGTLAVDFSNLSSPSDAAVTVRVATPVEEESGRAGLAYLGLNPDSLLTGPGFITGLRQNSQDRSNVAVQNAGVSGEESITLRVTVFSGDPVAPGSLMLPDRTLPPGGFYQYNEILNEAGFDNGYVRVERVEGMAPFYAYGVINDNFNSDGSFVFPVIESSLEGTSGQTLPVIIETGAFTSELTVTNFSPLAKTVNFHFVAEAVETDDDTAGFSLDLEAGEQRILPNVVDNLRRKGVAGIGPADQSFVGALFATVAEEDMSGIVMGARTGAPDGRGGQYGLFYNGVPYGSASTGGAWIYGLQQNAENRSNLALVNTGEVDDSNSTFEIDIYDGESDSQPRTKSVTLGPRRWYQFNGILGARSQGFVQVRQIRGNNPFVTYGVINDGGKRGQRSGDGAFLPNR